MINSVFYQGTTPTHTFGLPFPMGVIADLSITYSQKGRVVVRKTMEDCVIEGNGVAVTLTQKDTLSFNPDYVLEVQLKVLSKGGDVLASSKQRMAVERILDQEEFLHEKTTKFRHG